MSEILALFLAGLGLFFTGVDAVRTNLQQLSSRRFRQLLTRLTNRPLLAALAGAGFGALTQSATAVAFILSGMVSTGLITLRRALPVVAAANVGTAVLVFLAAFDFRLAVLYLIGVTGLLLSFRVLTRHDAVLGALFGIGLLFFGLDLMKRAVGPLPSYDWFRALVAFLGESALAPLLLGIATRMLIQSSSAIGVIAIALNHAGLFSAQQAMLLICGAGPGLALSGYFLGNATRRAAPGADLPRRGQQYRRHRRRGAAARRRAARQRRDLAGSTVRRDLGGQREAARVGRREIGLGSRQLAEQPRLARTLQARIQRRAASRAPPPAAAPAPGAADRGALATLDVASARNPSKRPPCSGGDSPSPRMRSAWPGRRGRARSSIARARIGTRPRSSLWKASSRSSASRARTRSARSSIRRLRAMARRGARGARD